MKQGKILGIETSCDETAASVVFFKEKNIKILSNVINSQVKIHKKYGGVFPELAAREHLINILPVIDKALIDAGIGRKNVAREVSLISFAGSPGLITSLLIGSVTANVLACTWGIEFKEVDHVESHICANFFNKQRIEKIEFPAIALTVSGGHTSLVYMKSFGKFEVIGTTLDDAAGEAFDKAAKMLDLGYPGGPVISKMAESLKKKTEIVLPRPMENSKDFNFSFSGLKTSLFYKLQKDLLWEKRKKEYSWAVEDAITDILLKKTFKAVQKFKAKSVLLSGGVSANYVLRDKFDIFFKKEEIPVYYPPLELCTDNAVMVAIRAGLFN